MSNEDLTQFLKLKRTCEEIVRNPQDDEKIKELNECMQLTCNRNLQNFHKNVLCSFYPILKETAKNKYNVSKNVKIAMIEVLDTLFKKIKLERVELFLNIYGFLLNEIVTDKGTSTNEIISITEEYKLIILQCVTSLVNCLNSDVVIELYTKEHAPKLCQIIFEAINIARKEKFKKLRIEAIKCIVALARVEEEDDENDIVLKSQIADVFMFYFPGIMSGLRDVAIEDEKFGHAIVVEAIRAFRKIVKLVMKDYDKSPETYEIDSFDITKFQRKPEKVIDEKEKKWVNEQEVKDYLQNMKRDENWFKKTDSKLQLIVKDLKRTTNHSHPTVREEMALMSGVLIENCSSTIPSSLCHITEILITLSEDEYSCVSERSKKSLDFLSENISNYEILAENLEENFYKTVTDLPKIFNNLDEQKQLGSANLLVGYLKLFNKHELHHVLHSPAHLQRLILSLIHINKIETKNVTQLEDWLQDVFAEESNICALPSFKKFTYVQNQKIASKLAQACYILGSNDEVADIVVDFLLNFVQNDDEDVKETIYVLNEVISGVKREEIIENVINKYLDPHYNDLPLYTCDIQGNKYPLGQVQNNILIVCLILEGIGKIAGTLGPAVEKYLLKIMYPILEKAGSPQPLLRRVGLETLKELSRACGHNSITELINANSDYFSYHVARRIQKIEHNAKVLNVLCVVMEHSSVDVLPSISHIIEGILMQTCDKYFQERKANPFLNVFKTFVKCLTKWFDVKPIIKPINKSKAEIEERTEDFKVSGIEEINNFDDEIMNKSAEQMYEEDLEKSKEQIEKMEEPDEEYKKPEAPTHVKLTTALLKRCLNFLPFKDRNTKLLVLEILKNGVELIRDWEDELLPIVHLIWSPLVNRFKETEEHVIVNYSFQLLVTLARLSKWFIRSRTVKDVLPQILLILEKLHKESYLKDKGSPYRYTQAYKLQLTLLEHFSKLAIDLEMGDENLSKVTLSVLFYLSDKQPIPLQELCLKFFKDLITYDKQLVMKTLDGKLEDLEYRRNKANLEKLIEKN